MAGKKPVLSAALGLSRLRLGEVALQAGETAAPALRRHRAESWEAGLGPGSALGQAAPSASRSFRVLVCSRPGRPGLALREPALASAGPWRLARLASLDSEGPFGQSSLVQVSGRAESASWEMQAG